MGIKTEHFGRGALPLCVHFTHFLKKKCIRHEHYITFRSPLARIILDLIIFTTKALLKVEKDEGPLTRSSSGKWRLLCRDLQLTRLSPDHSDEVPLIYFH